MSKQRTITLPDFLTEDQIRTASLIYDLHKRSGRVAGEIAKRVIEPNLAEINRKLGQENDAHYLAYCCEYVFSKLEAGHA